MERGAAAHVQRNAIELEWDRDAAGLVDREILAVGKRRAGDGLDLLGPGQEEAARGAGADQRSARIAGNLQILGNDVGQIAGIEAREVVSVSNGSPALVRMRTWRPLTLLLTSVLALTEGPTRS